MQKKIGQNLIFQACPIRYKEQGKCLTLLMTLKPYHILWSAKI